MNLASSNCRSITTGLTSYILSVLYFKLRRLLISIFFPIGSRCLSGNNAERRNRGVIDYAMKITIPERQALIGGNRWIVVRFICLYLRVNHVATRGHVYKRTREDEEHARHAEISTRTIMSMA